MPGHTRFDADTALRPAGPGRFEGAISPDWQIVRGANGGHLAAILLRAATEMLGEADRRPRSLDTHFLSVPRADRIEVQAAVERAGRSVATVLTRLVQDGRPVTLATATFVRDLKGPEWSDLALPEVPPPEELEPVPDRDDFPFGRHFDFRPCHPLGPGGRAEVAVWMRLREPRELDGLLVAQLCDAFAPAVFARLGRGGGGAGVPTIEMTTYFREPLPLDLPSDAFVLGIFRSTVARGGLVEEDGWLYAPDGRLVAQSRQLALLTGP